MIKEPYNPLDKRNLGINVAEAMLMKNIEKMPVAKSFDGAGIYAIYYTGSFAPYKPIAEANTLHRFNLPIYVGKAIPAGARKGGLGLDAPAGPVLYKRLCEHAQSIEQTKNLHLLDFRCRYLIVDDIWIPLGESLLIETFTPLWNMVLDGFGNHDPGGGRYNQQISPWDVIHPGRSWASKLKPGKSRCDILEAIQDHLSKKADCKKAP
ncbi:MAG: Eco29kI family restriction endonuclease [bacterium]|nr:Eco29kI family restriction endonuclease [bacterium]